jgi:phosphatidate cytidylyltransferase
MSSLGPRGGYAGSRSSDPDTPAPYTSGGLDTGEEDRHPRHRAPDEGGPETYVNSHASAGDRPAHSVRGGETLDPYGAYRVPGEDRWDTYPAHHRRGAADGGRPTSLEDAAPPAVHVTDDPARDGGTAATSTAPAGEQVRAEREAAHAEGSAADTRPSAPDQPLEAGGTSWPGPHRRGRRRAGHRGRSGTLRGGRAGRNLPAAIAVGLGLGLLVLAPLILYKPAFLGVIALAACVGIWEVARAVRTAGANPPLVPLLAGGLLIIGLTWYAGTDALVLGLVVTLLATIVWRLADGPAQLRRDLTASVLIAVYVPFLLAFAVLLVEPDDGAWRVLSALIAVVLSDTGGYAAGVFLGKHPMAPTISPKKSWEGFAGSILAAAVGSALVFFYAFHVPFYWGVVFGAAVSAVAVVGDLAESMLKRDLGIKDMSRLLPGHGGLMDRLDSILFAVPTAYLLLSLLAPPR